MPDLETPVRPAAVDFISYITTWGCGKSRSLGDLQVFFLQEIFASIFLDPGKPLNAVISIVK